MNQRILFMIIGEEVKLLQDSTMDHREWYLSLGLEESNFDQIVRGFIENNRIIFYKGSTFSYDDDVINAAKKYTPNIRYQLGNQALEVYCGIYFQAGEKWEPILKIGEDEITGFVKEEPKKEVVVKSDPVQSAPIIELKNDFNDENFRKKAIIVTGVVLVLTFIIKIMLFQQKQILKLDHFMDVLFVLGQLGLLGVTIYGYLNKKEFAKYSGIAASLLIILTMDFFDIVIGILYFLFCIDQNYYVKMIEFVKKTIDSFTNKKSS